MENYMATIFEFGMLVCFGASWPFNIAKSYRARTAKGKSLVFEILVVIGYCSGIIGKLINHNINYVLIVYILDLAMVVIDLLLMLRNRKLDALAEK